MLDSLLKNLQGFQGDYTMAFAQVTPAIWRQILMLLVGHLRAKVHRELLSEVLPDGILRLIMRIMPQSVPELAPAFSIFCSPAAQAVLLNQVVLRETLRDRVLLLPDMVFMEEVEVISALFSTFLECAILQLTDLTTQLQGGQQNSFAGASNHLACGMPPGTPYDRTTLGQQQEGGWQARPPSTAAAEVATMEAAAAASVVVSRETAAAAALLRSGDRWIRRS